MSFTTRSTMIGVSAFLRLLEELRQGGLAVLLVARSAAAALLGRDDVAREVEQCLEELDARQQPLLVPLLEVLEPLAQRLEARIVQPLAQPRETLISISLAFLSGSGVPSTASSRSASSTSVSRSSRIASTCTCSWISSIVFGPSACHRSLPGAGRRLHRLVDLRRASGSRSRSWLRTGSGEIASHSRAR